MIALLAPIVSLTLSTHTCFAPCQIRVTVRIENAQASDKARLEISGVAASDIIVEDDKRTYTMPNPRNGTYTIHEPGEYIVSVTLLRRGEKPQTAQLTLVVNET